MERFIIDMHILVKKTTNVDNYFSYKYILKFTYNIKFKELESIYYDHKIDSN